MSDHVFYAKGRSRGNQRKVVISNPQCLVGKAPTKAKRIKLKLTIGLSTQKQSGTPEWIAAAHEFVAKNHDTVQPKVDLRGFDINFAAENLFHPQGIQASKCQMRRFLITEMGETEAPDVVLTFVVYSSFSTELWGWLGQMAGDEVWAQFAQADPGDENEDEEEDDEEDDGDEAEQEEPDTETVQMSLVQ